MNLFVIFLTGLTTGGLSCLAMQGGLLAGVVSNQKKHQQRGESESEESNLANIEPLNQKSIDKLDWLPAVLFMAAKLVAHTILGFFLGWLGSALTLTVTLRLIFQTLAAFFMLATAMNLLNVHPIFRYVVFQPPKFLQKLVKDSTKSEALFSPAILGMMTVFIPCGVTQAMIVLAMNSASPIAGATIMFSFILGTAPIFTLLGLLTAKLSGAWNQLFHKVAATSLILLSIFSLNGVLLVMDSPLTLNNLSSAVMSKTGSENSPVGEVAGVQKVVINIENYGYDPQRLTVRKGIPVELTVQSNGIYSCSYDFVFRKFNIHAFLEPTDSRTFTFTPQETGQYTFACLMGMYSGVMEVI